MVEITDKLTAFLDHFMALTGTDGTDDSEASFNKEFQALKIESQQYKEQNVFPVDSGQLPFNKKKNRFKDILPFEYTRVQLHKIEGVEGSDYINANYIQGPDGNVSYIAAQGPLPHTVDDFWRMLWYHQIEIVVMACKEVEMAKPKCQAYWPPLGECVNFGAIKVTTNHEEQVSDDFIIRQMTAECQGEEQIIRQFHYTAWPDHGRPMSATPIIRMIEMYHDYRKRHDIPFVVHCSAGCGRTGTIIAIDFARTMLTSESIPEEFSVYSIVQLMRRQRPAMVQALDQYVFVYMAVIELVQRQLTNIPQLPPKMLKFEKEVPEATPTPASTDDSVYQNVTSCLSDEPTPAELAPPNPPRPLSRTPSGGSGSDVKPHPPPKPVKPTKPEVAKKPDRPEVVAKKPPEVVAKKPPAPVPVPRKPSNDSSSSLSTPPTSTVPPTALPTVPSSTVPVPVPRKYSPVPPPSNEHYSVPKQTSTPSKIGGPNVSSSSISSTPGGDKSVSKSSILETLILEVGTDVFDSDDRIEVGVASNETRAPDYTYSTLNNVIPPQVPAQTLDSTELLITSVASPLYETADISMPVQSGGGGRTLQPTRPISPSSSSLAFSVATMKPSDVKPSKTKRFSDDTSSHPGSSKTISSSPRKQPKQTPSTGANTKYTFSGNFGYGVRVGKPKGPRPEPHHWNMINGITH